MFAVLIPAGFTPEAHGWEPADNGATSTWLRWWPPYRWPQSLAYVHQCECERQCGGWVAWYGDQPSTPEARPYSELLAEIRSGKLPAGISPFRHDA